MNTIEKIFRFFLHSLLYLAIGGFFITGLLRLGLLIFGRKNTYPPENSPDAQVALVLGAGLNRDGSPGIVLRDRVRRASELYFDGKVEKILMSGDNSSVFYNEPGAMKNFALSLGVPEQDIVLDYAGRRTYDSCYRAKAIFGVERALVVTQAYHLPRALFLCNAVGLSATGVRADDADYRLGSYAFWWTREILASIMAYWDVYISHPVPVLGNPEPIFPQ